MSSPLTVTAQSVIISDMTKTYKIKIEARDNRAFRNLVKELHKLDATFDGKTKIWTVRDDCVTFRTERRYVEDCRTGPNAAYHASLGRTFADFDPFAYFAARGLTVVEEPGFVVFS